MGRPAPNILFAQSFKHHHPGEHVDEVRFAEPVVISACEVVEHRASSQCTSVSITGISIPESFSLELFVRNGGEARFRRLCPAFMFSSSAPTLHDPQVSVTDHLVVRGSYDTLTLVIYGNTASDLGQLTNHELESPIPEVPTEASYRTEDLPEALHPRKVKSSHRLHPLQYLHLVPKHVDHISVVQQILYLASNVGRGSLDAKVLHKTVKALVSAATALHVTDSGASCANLWAIFAKSQSLEEKKKYDFLLEAAKELQELQDKVEKIDNQKHIDEGKQENDDYSKFQATDERRAMFESKSEESEWALQLILHWIQDGVQSSDGFCPVLFPVESLIGGLAATQLLCTDTRECFQFVLAGGMQLLIDVIEHLVGNFSATTVLALRAVEVASRHAFACDALLGWWGPGSLVDGEVADLQGTSRGYSALLRLLLQQQQQPIALLAARVLHRLRAYELAAYFQSAVDTLLDEPFAMTANANEEKEEGKLIDRASLHLKQLLKLLTVRNFMEKEILPFRTSKWLAIDVEDTGTVLPPCASFGGLVSSRSSIVQQDIDPFLLSVLRERRFLPLLAALLSSPRLRSSQGYAMNSCVELLGMIESLFLTFLSCRSGLLLLASEPEAISGVVVALQRLQDLLDKDISPLRHAVALTSVGFLCRPQDIGWMLQTSLSVITIMDCILSPSRGPESLFWMLWELANISRIEHGRQAVLMLTWFPEVLDVLMEALHLGPESILPGSATGETWRRAGVHFAAEVLLVVLSDTAPSTLAAWTPHAVTMQRALLSSLGQIEMNVGSNGVEDRDACCACLLEWLEAAVVYHKKGAVGLLKYATSLSAGGGGNQQNSGGPVGEIMDLDANIGDQPGAIDSSSVPTMPKNWSFTENTPSSFSDTAYIQLTVSFRILASVSCYPGVSAVLYGEGAMVVVYAILDHCAAALHSTNEYDAVMDEDMEEEMLTEELVEHVKERLMLGLLLPTLLLLLTLLRSLQGAVQSYQNTRLIDVLLLLHHSISAKTASHASVPPHAWAGLTQELVAVRHIVASILACWPTFGWTPALLPRLLGDKTMASTGLNSTSLPVEPGIACSILCLLADMLPQETPQLCNSKSSLRDVYRSLAVSSIVGTPCTPGVDWHSQSPYAEKLLRALVHHLDQISSIVLHLTPTNCELLQDMLKVIIIRLACRNVDHAAVLVRPILAQIREQFMPNNALSEHSIFQVEHILKMTAGLLRHPASKSVLIKEGVIEILLQAARVSTQVYGGDRVFSATYSEISSLTCCWPWIFKSIASLCNPEVSCQPLVPLGRRLMDDCPSFEDCCSIASMLLNLFEIILIGKEIENLIEAFEKLASHKLGRAAIAHTAMLSVKKSSTTGVTSPDHGKASAISNDVSNPVDEKQDQTMVFLEFWHRLNSAFKADQCSGKLYIHIVHRLCLSALVLTDAGKSFCGVVAAQMLFGAGNGLGFNCYPAAETAEMLDGEKLQALEYTSTMIRLHVEGVSTRSQPEATSSLLLVSLTSLQEAHISIMALLHILEHSTTLSRPAEKVHAMVEGLSDAQVTRKRNKIPRVARLRPHMRILSALVPTTRSESYYLEKDGSNEESSLGKAAEISADSRCQLIWECPVVSQDRTAMALTSVKRKTIATIEVGKKRARADLSASTVSLAEGPSIPGGSSSAASLGRPGSGSATPVTQLSRRDTFRQRKPNTSRPPSMHVDDYVARERSSDVVPVGSTAAPILRTGSSSGRPPSIHVDEFMARQQERLQTSGSGGSVAEYHQQSIRHSGPPSQDSSKKDVVESATSGKAQDDEGQGGSMPGTAGIQNGTELLHAGQEGKAFVPMDVNLKTEKNLDVSILINTNSAETEENPAVASSSHSAESLTIQSKVPPRSFSPIQRGANFQRQTQEGKISNPSQIDHLQRIDFSKEASTMSTAVEVHLPAGPFSGVLTSTSHAEEGGQPQQPILSSRIPETLNVTLQAPTLQFNSLTLPSPLTDRVLSQDSQTHTMTPLREQKLSLQASVLQRVYDSQSSSIMLPYPPNSLSQGFPTSQLVHMGSQYISREQRPIPSAATPLPQVSDRNPHSSDVGLSQPRDSRPLDTHRERTATDFSSIGAPLPPQPSAWPMLDPSLRTSMLQSAPSRPTPPAFNTLVSSGSQRPSSEVHAGGMPVPQVPPTPWPGLMPNARLFEDTNRAHLALPVGQIAPIHGSIQGPGKGPSAIPAATYSHSVGSMPVEIRPITGLSGAQAPTNDRRFSVSLPNYSSILPPLQSSTYIPPPVPSGRPGTPHGPLTTSITAQQQQLQSQMQQQNIVQIQQQQLQLRQIQLQQHTQSQQIQMHQLHQQPQQQLQPQQLHQQAHHQPQQQPQVQQPQPQHQQQPQLQQPQPPLQQPQQPPRPLQPESVMLQQMLASPDAIQALLKDQNKLRELLEQHPKLISLLQEKMSQSAS